MRTHVVLSDNLVHEIDRLVGKRKRSRFVEEAVREKLRTRALLEAIESSAGALSANRHPEWDTSEKAASWVRESRRTAIGHGATVVTANVKDYPMEDLDLLSQP